MISGALSFVESTGMNTHTSAKDTTHSLFKTIPPERVGIDGQYDYNGLANRVTQALEQQFSYEELQHLTVRQRGTVVMLSGKLSSQHLLQKIRCASLNVSGATDVEIHGVDIVPQSAYQGTAQANCA
ncbi:phospholipid-binding protein [Thermoleptolyngbya sichuanensis A183]|uniref:Phospholipid-binding protein n=1 Tax=Thermoleptolyngbya sichuanensis A183 TaxID=2737172 RepID=A0A6M8BBE1_9CYAN|nr:MULTISPECIES: phospholipid-binding protein [Thermoleptolyngbya]QKD83412.1 phospholipid-binding protein [Thermoleptolyngbya sichuanensis A183]